MKIVHIESGLGNQMLSFCEYIALKMMNPEDDVYVETVIYDIPECNDIICQWNGYELNRIFGINAPNIRERFDEKNGKNSWEKFDRVSFGKGIGTIQSGLRRHLMIVDFQ